MADPLFRTVQFQLSGLLQSIELGKLALPELQRPFVWPATKARDLFDSMYRGFPIGFVMLWQGDEPDSRYIGAGGKQQRPSETIVDGQQRLTSLYAVMKGEEVTFKDFSKGRLVLSFRPRDGRFEVADAATMRDPEFLSDISALWMGKDWEVINDFIAQLATARPEAMENGSEEKLRDALSTVRALDKFPVQAMQIGLEVDEEQVSEIFLRVNSGGTPLTQADFILTLLSVFREEDRRRLEHFALLCRTVPTGGQPSPFNHLVAPSADQLLRVAVLVGFRRGRLQSVLALLRRGALDDEQSVAEQDRLERLNTLTKAIDETLDLTSWHEYIKILMSAGFRRSNEISSFNNVVLVYALYLIGRGYGLSHSELRTTIARFFFMSALTGRYTGSFENQITQDVQALADAATGDDYLDRLRSIISARLTEDYWNINLPGDLATSSARSPQLFAYAASLSLLGARVPPFVAANGKEQKAAVLISSLFDPVVSPKKAAVDRHHLFPRKHLENVGISGTRAINQIANLAYVEWPENIEISDTPPSEYWPRYAAQFSASDRFHHALAEDWATMDYDDFLADRRNRIAQVIRKGFEAIGAPPTPGESDGNATITAGGFQDTYLDPHQPFSNELAVRQLIRQLRGEVLWYEQHMDRKALEILAEELVPQHVTAVRLLSGPANLTSKTKKAFAKFAQEFDHSGILCEWRVLTADEARLMHARVLFDDDRAFELPPLNSVLAGGVDSIRQSDMPRETFERAWNGDNVALEDYASAA